MSELFSIQLQNQQQQGRDGVWLDLPTTTEQVQAALRQIGISSDNPQGLFISGYFAEEEKRFAIPYNMVLASNVDELNFLASRLETLSTGERAELNAALQAPQSELSSIGRITDFPENVDYYVYLPDVRGPAQLGDYYLNRSGMVDMPEEWKGGIDTAQFGRYVAQQEQGVFTEYGYLVKSGDVWQKVYEGQPVPEEYKTKRGSPKWADSTVIGIIKNEKYKGDILLGKTFTVDPISKRRLYNFGEEDQFYIREHHEPIISEEVFEAAQEILRRRAKPRSLNVDGKREKFSRKYAFSCMIECGFCGGTLTRRSWHSSSQYNKAIWQCVVSTKKGKKFCPESKGVDERTIERAFVESYRLLCQNNKDVLDEFMKRTEEALSESNAGKRLAKAEKDIHALEVKKNKLVDMRLEDTIDKETYDRKYLDLSSQIEQLQKECESLQDAAETETTMRKRVAMFRQTLEQNEVLDTFDRHIFESIVEKVIVGGYDSDGNKDPYMIVFVYKTGFKNSVDGKNFKPLRKNSKENHSPAVLCSHASNEAESMCSDSSDDTCRDGGVAGAGRGQRRR